MTATYHASRDKRIDLVRVLALLVVIVDHVHENSLRQFTPGRIGFSDMAEVFFFLSGYVCAISYNRVLSRDGFWPCQRKASIRCLQLYSTNLLMICAFLSLTAG